MNTETYCWTEEELAPARGCMFGVLFGTLFWLPFVGILLLVVLR